MKLFVKNIEESVNEALLEAIFKQFGEIVSTKIVYDKITWESRGFGFVEFKKSQDAMKAMDELQGKELVGKKLIIMEALEKGAGG
ncbi:MAG TPA: RNA-binding protein [Bacteroidia bacterium]|jgi:RNA recognition motif-containing protein|nr:RNA-binding protein [Bacteroidia bacterium]